MRAQNEQALQILCRDAELSCYSLVELHDEHLPCRQSLEDSVEKRVVINTHRTSFP